MRIRNLFLLLLFLSLISCGTIQNPLEIQYFLYKPFPFKRDVFICESTAEPGYFIVDPTEPNTLCRHALNDWTYRANPSLWNQWRGNRTSKDRIIAFLPRDTHFIIQEYRVPDLLNQSRPVAFILIIDGPYCGMELRWPRFKINNDMPPSAWKLH